ncbi:MAG: LemA family protein [archaeon]|jgi:LemA protein
MNIAIWVILGIIAVLVIIALTIFNSLIIARNKVKNGWSQIDVQLKKRYDLVPNLVETVKGYAKHEAGTLSKITELRNQAMQSKDIKATMKTNDQMSKAIGGLLSVVVENYPDLKASQNFLMLQEELSGIENKIAYARQYYNDIVMDYNNKIQTVPNNMFANAFNFKEETFLEASQEEKKNVKVSF